MVEVVDPAALRALAEQLRELEQLASNRTTNHWAATIREDATAQVYAPDRGPMRMVVPIAETTADDAEFIIAMRNGLKRLIDAYAAQAEELTAVCAQRDALCAAVLPTTWQVQTHEVILGNAQCHREDAEILDTLDNEAEGGPQLREKLRTLAAQTETLAKIGLACNREFRRSSDADAFVAEIRALLADKRHD